MKLAITFTLALTALLFVSCKNDGKTTATDSQTTTAPAAPVATGAVMHYICPNNCAGSGGDVGGTCPVCGTEYLHNDAFHAQDNQTPPQPTLSGPQNPQMQQPTLTPPAPTADPAQNAAGVWHYTCSAGCPGGSGTAGNCTKCGGALAHNAAYHQ